MTRRLVLAALLLALAPAAHADPPAELTVVERWYMTFEYEETGSTTTATEDWNLLISASGSAVLEHVDDPDELFGRWEGVPSIQVSYAYTGAQQNGPMCRYEDEINGSGPPVEAGTASLRFFADGYQLDPGHHWVGVTDIFRDYCPDEHITTLNNERSWMAPDIISDSIPYPEMGTELAGTLQEEGRANVEDTMEIFPAITQVTLTYRFAPEMAKLKLKIRDGDEYAAWRPTAGDGGGPGKPLEIRAELVTESGKASPVAVKRFIWTLKDTSREPGVSMNFPASATDNELDLRLEADVGDSAEIYDEGQRLERELASGTTDVVRIVPYDYGAWAVLEVRAILVDGQEIVGETGSSEEKELRLPRRAASSFVADAWKEQKSASGADDADDENDPVGDGTRGDGLSLYQEYRGFHENGQHIEGEPAQKDLFVHTVEAARPGVIQFAGLSGLAVHHQLRKSELPESRVINANKTRGPGPTVQHGVVVAIHGPAAAGLVGKLGEAIGGPANPKGISEVRLMSNWMALDEASRKQVVAHEMFHTVNVHHHGETDKPVAWLLDDVGDVAEVDSVGRTAIEVFHEPDINVTESWRDFLSKKESVLKWVGVDGGQHSGNDSCVMRYFNAGAYVGNPDVTRRYITKEAPAAGLCSVATATGVNDMNRMTPQSRFGEPKTGRGACAKQILVNDKVDPPEH